MKYPKIIYWGLGIGLIICLILGWIIFCLQKNQELKIIFFNVGQGDAILIESGRNQIIIDGGRNEELLLERLGEFMPFWDRTIEAIVVTHPDSDHFGGLIGALKNYRVKNVIKTKARSKSQIWRKMENIIAEKKVNKILAINGLNIKFPNLAKIETLFPFFNVAEYPKKTNDTSVVMKLVYGKNSFLFTGDLPSNKEDELLQTKINLKSEVLKVGHHGSRFSTSDDFLEAVDPKDAIISVGKNSYSHPTKEVLDKLKRRLVRIWRTDQDGNIIYQCKDAVRECFVFAE
ncbi:MAG TPA: MBL fold metallo-hydrolase [Candidatus Moranbacteria bacterium]|nr:MBL fold metallo-hydrolase [Candidatus Moranbacteria bacterium]